MDTSALSSSFDVQLPAWVTEEVAALPAGPITVEDGMRLLNRLALANVREGGGGPFAAMVVDPGNGQIVSVGVNRVLASGLSSMHAEVTALSLAQKRLGAWDLGAADAPALELWVNWRPCVMCYGATMWSGVRSLVIAGEGPEVEELTGFDEGPMPEGWADRFRERGIEVEVDVLRDEAIEVFEEYRQMVEAGQVTVYNARGAAFIAR